MSTLEWLYTRGAGTKFKFDISALVAGPHLAPIWLYTGTFVVPGYPGPSPAPEIFQPITVKEMSPRWPTIFSRICNEHKLLKNRRCTPFFVLFSG